MSCFLAVSHNVHIIVDVSGDWKEKCCMVVAWYNQHGYPSTIVTKRKKKDRFKHRARIKCSFSVGHKRRNKIDLKYLAVT